MKIKAHRTPGHSNNKLGCAGTVVPGEETAQQNDAESQESPAVNNPLPVPSREGAELLATSHSIQIVLFGTAGDWQRTNREQPHETQNTEKSFQSAEGWSHPLLVPANRP